MPLLPPPPLLASPTLPFPPPPATRPATPPPPDTYRAEGKVQRVTAVCSLLREDLRHLWGESNPAQATLLQQCLQLESEATERLQQIRDRLRQMPAPGPGPSDAA